MIDHKRNNRVKIRNFSENQDFHDIVKLLLVKMIRRQHPNIKQYRVYTEYNEEDPNRNYPDIYVYAGRYKNRHRSTDIYVWEIQRNITQSWLKKIQDQHKEVNLIVVPLKKIKDKWEENLLKELRQNKKFEPVQELRKILEDYVV